MTTQSSQPSWLTALLAFAPSINQLILVLTTAALTMGGTLIAQRHGLSPERFLPASLLPASPSVDRLTALESRISALESQSPRVRKATAK